MMLLHHAHALAVNENNAECAEFVSQACGEIRLRKEKVKMRSNLVGNASNEEVGTKALSETDATKPLGDAEQNTEQSNTVAVNFAAA